MYEQRNFLAFDDEFAVYAKICLTSIIYNYKDHPEIIIYYDGTDKSIIRYLKSLERVKLIHIENSFLKKFTFNLGPINKKIIYIRYLLWSDYFDGYDNILHLDADTVILKSLSSLFEKNVFFAISDFTPKGYLFNEKGIKSKVIINHLMRCGVTEKPSNILMLNAGVFLIPKKYRSKLYANQLLSITKTFDKYIKYADQSAISLWCLSNKFPVSTEIIYNFQVHFFANFNLFYNNIISDKVLNDIHILHLSSWKFNTHYYNQFLELSSIFKENHLEIIKYLKN